MVKKCVICHKKVKIRTVDYIHSRIGVVCINCLGSDQYAERCAEVDCGIEEIDPNDQEPKAEVEYPRDSIHSDNPYTDE